MIQNLLIKSISNSSYDDRLIAFCQNIDFFIAEKRSTGIGCSVSSSRAPRAGRKFHNISKLKNKTGLCHGK